MLNCKIPRGNSVSCKIISKYISCFYFRFVHSCMHYALHTLHHKVDIGLSQAGGLGGGGGGALAPSFWPNS